jgi:beta-glucosidase
MSLPPSFEFGVATSAFQIEGAWNEDGKGVSIWDTFSQTPGKIQGDVNGNIACDHYHRYPEDIAIMKHIGVDSYRLSLSWARLLPEGTGLVNAKGADFYKRLLDDLNSAGIRPNVTLYHWDLPQALQDRGGWPNRDVAEWFADYSTTAFDLFGDRVDQWSTLNEPIAQWVGYGLGWFAPGVRDARAGRQAMHNSMLAHGRSVQAFRAANTNPASTIGIVLDIWKREPLTPTAEDRALADEGEDDGFRFFLDTLRGGGYSDRLRERLEREGTFPEVAPQDQAIIESPIDWLGLNIYSRVVVDSTRQEPGTWAQSNPNPGGNFLDNGSEFYPRAVYEAVQMVRDDYAWRGPIYITENGLPDAPGSDPLVDDERIRYVSGFLEWIERAVDEGSDVRGYYLWSLLDNYEWSAAFTMRYGIVHVDPDTLVRTPKKSAQWYRDLIASHRGQR